MERSMALRRTLYRYYEHRLESSLPADRLPSTSGSFSTDIAVSLARRPTVSTGLVTKQEWPS